MKTSGWGFLFLSIFILGSSFLFAGAMREKFGADASGSYLLAQTIESKPEQPVERGATKRTPFYFPTPKGYRMKIPVGEGEAIFQDVCVLCHTIGDGIRVGPDLESVTTRRPEDYLLNFITDPKRMIKEGNIIAVEFFNELKITMPDLGLSEQQILGILEYIKVRSGIPVSPVAFPISADAAASEATIESQGEVLFQLDCAMCHTIGDGPKVGPDLKGITKKRPHEWLLDFITDSETMFAEKNPLAMSLLKEFDNVKMPNIYLNKAQVEYVLVYIKSES